MDIFALEGGMNKEHLLPEPVYRQALWAVKDLPRMKDRLRELEYMADTLPQIRIDDFRSGSGRVSDFTGIKAIEISNLSMRIRAIEDALLEVPAQYRDGILHKLAYGVPYGDQFHANTWKKWQQVYLHQVAIKLQLV